MILLRHLASYLAIPAWITDATGNLIYYNEPAEDLLGGRFDEVGEIGSEALDELFVTTDLDGTPIPNAELPLLIALEERHPSHRTFRINRLDGNPRVIELTAIPVVGQGDRFLGALCVFWEKH